MFHCIMNTKVYCTLITLWGFERNKVPTHFNKTERKVTLLVKLFSSLNNLCRITLKKRIGPQKQWPHPSRLCDMEGHGTKTLPSPPRFRVDWWVKGCHTEGLSIFVLLVHRKFKWQMDRKATNGCRSTWGTFWALIGIMNS
jgi:hypothetical protein